MSDAMVGGNSNLSTIADVAVTPSSTFVNAIARSHSGLEASQSLTRHEVLGLPRGPGSMLRPAMST